MPEPCRPCRAAVSEQPAVHPILLRSLRIVGVVLTGGYDDPLRQACGDVVEEDVAAARPGLLVLVLLAELDRRGYAGDVINQAALARPRLCSRLHLLVDSTAPFSIER